MIRPFFALLLACALPAFAAEPASAPNRFAFTLAPTEQFDVGATLVQRYGARGTPMILIPGLASGAWTWQSTVRQFMGEHTIYVLTLPGFAGRAPVDGKGLAAAEASVKELIESRRLAKPVLVGHSMGATMSLSLAARYPDLVGGVVAIDGLPVMPGTEDWALDQRPALAATISKQMRAANPALFANQQRGYMRGTGVVDMDRADELAKLTAASDPAAVSRYMGEIMAQDLRPLLPSIKAPVLVVSPFFPADGEQLQMSEQGKSDYYLSLMKGTPDVKVRSVSPARHFAMFDQPAKVNDAIGGFLKTLPK
jgi:pimeloyl-ACP methyl ester carboxylesterase